MMRATRVSLVLLALLALAVALLEASGRQPERDAVAAAERELGIPLDAGRSSVGDVDLFVVQAGPRDGAPVLLLHGFPEFWYAWRGVMAELAGRGFRVIAPDQRGYGRSDKPAAVAAYRIDRLAADAAGLVEALGHERAFVAGHDWGGAVAWQLAIDRPERVRRLAVLGTPHPRAERSPASDDEETISWYRAFFQIPWLPERVARVANWRMPAGTLRDTSAPGTFPEPVLDLYRSAWDHEDAMSSMVHWYRAAWREPPPERASWRVRVPALVVLAAEDAFIPASLTRGSLEWLDDGRLVELARGTHWVIQEHPDAVAAVLADFYLGR